MRSRRLRRFRERAAAMLQSLGLVGTIAEGDAGPEDPESGGSEDEEVRPGRIYCLGWGG